MSIIDRVRRWAGTASPDPADLPRATVPSWLLLPGIVLFCASLAAYVQVIRHYEIFGLDLRMYRGGLDAFLHGRPVYRLGYTRLDLPYTYPPVTLLFLLPLAVPASAYTALYGFNAVGIAALLLVVWFTTKMLGHRGTAGRIGLVGAVAAVMLWTEPFQQNFTLGQVNVLVMLPVVIDLSLSNRSRFKGIGIGVATASKLLPGLFIVYLLLTRRIRAAVTAGVTFAVLTAVGWVIQPGGSKDYWIDGRAFDSHRVLMILGPRFEGNQSLQGLTARLLNTQQQNTVFWMISVAVVAVGGLALAVAAQRRGEEAMGMVAVGFTALMISPVSWSHYWLWIAPLLVVLGDVARRSAGRVQTFAAGVATVAIMPFLILPLTVADRGPIVPVGLIWVASRHHGLFGRIADDPYIPTVLVLFLLAALWLRTGPVPDLERETPAVEHADRAGEPAPVPETAGV